MHRALFWKHKVNKKLLLKIIITIIIIIINKDETHQARICV